MLNNEIALRNVYDMLWLLTSNGSICWVQDGTLLGLMRDGAVIRWDRDTDIGLYHSTWKPENTAILEQAGFVLKDQVGTFDNGWQHRWIREGVKTDIFFYYTDDSGGMWHAAYLRNTIQYRFHYKPFKLTRVETSVGSMPAPDPPEAFLEAKYGPDWRTPKRQWHFAASPLNGVRMP